MNPSRYGSKIRLNVLVCAHKLFFVYSWFRDTSTARNHFTDPPLHTAHRRHGHGGLGSGWRQGEQSEGGGAGQACRQGAGAQAHVRHPGREGSTRMLGVVVDWVCCPGWEYVWLLFHKVWFGRIALIRLSLSNEPQQNDFCVRLDPSWLLVKPLSAFVCFLDAIHHLIALVFFSAGTRPGQTRRGAGPSKVWRVCVLPVLAYLQI